MRIKLIKASEKDWEELYCLQITAFKPLLEKYQDYSHNPGAESSDKTLRRLRDPAIDYFFICLSEQHICVVRVSCSHDTGILKQLLILPEFQGKGYAQEAISLVESQYPSIRQWKLDTIKQEEKLCYLYEKMGYVKTGKEERIKAGMDLIYFAKQLRRPGNG